MNTIYQLRDNDTDELLGLYTFQNNSIDSEQITIWYFDYIRGIEIYDNFDCYLDSKEVIYERSFTEEIYV